jgi:N-glycosylase/DNA lyase
MATNSTPISSQQQPPKLKLLQVVRLALRRGHYSYRTEQSYLHWIRRFVRFHHRRHPRDMGAAEVTAFLNHLAAERRVASATQNQALSARCFCTERCSNPPCRGWMASSGPNGPCGGLPW